MKGIVVSILLLPVMTYGINLSNDGVTVEIDAKTGDVSSIGLKGLNVIKYAGEQWIFENVKGQKFSTYSVKNKTGEIKHGKGFVKITLANPTLEQKGIKISAKYFWEKDILVKRIELTNEGKEDLLLKAVSKTRFTDKIKRNGLYYVPYGAYCMPAKDIKLPVKIKNQIYHGIKNQIISVYDKVSGTLVASFVYRVNEKFTTVLGGFSVPSYLPGGWEFSSCLYYLRAGGKVSYDIGYYVCKGSPANLIRRWVKLDEIRKIRQKVWKNVRVPEWFKNVALVGFVYTPVQIEANHFLPNVKPLADKLPGNWMIIQWGSSHRALGEVKGYFKGYGQPVPPQCEDIRWATNDLPKIRKEVPNIKIGNYRYYWSMDDGSFEGVMHPEWRLLNRNGKPVYSGTSHRYARNPLIPQALESCVFTTREWYTYVPVDFHYVDGTDGAYPAWVGWKQRIAPQWYDWHKLFLKVYNLVHSDLIKPSVLFCNGAPVSCGDAGFVEIGGNNKNVWQGNDGWRGLADRCEMGKLWGPPHGFMCLLFWDRRTDLRYINHILAYGLVPNLSPGGARYTGSEGLDFCLPRVPYIKSAYEIRNSRLVYAGLKPDWRADGGNIEAVMLKIKDFYRLNVINHSHKKRLVSVSFDVKAIDIAGSEVELIQLELIPPTKLEACDSNEAFRIVKRWRKKIPAKGRCNFDIWAEPKILNTIVFSSQEKLNHGG